MSKFRKLFLFLFLLLCLAHPTTVEASLTSWTSAIDLPYSIASNTAATYLDGIFVFGGSSSLGGSRSDVLNTIDSGGNITPWTTISNSPLRLIWHTTTSSNDDVYILGGFLDSIDGVISYVDTVSFATKNSNNSLGGWSNTTPLPQKLALSSSASFNNQLFHAGGSTIPSQANNPNVAISEIYVSDINPDGTIGAWRIAGNLPQKTEGQGMLVINGYLVVFGGYTPTGYSNQVIRALINPDGSIGPWESLSSLPTGIWRFGITRVQNRVVIAGSDSTNVYYADINPDGTLTSWSNGPSLPESNCCGQLVNVGDDLFLIGGVANGNYTNHVWKTSFVDNTPTPTPTPTSTPIPTPTPTPTPAPITNKVVVVPGFGSGWNRNAFLSCQPDPNPNNWSLAPYAASVYEPLIESLAAGGWQVLPFYYDFRQPIIQSASQLQSLIGTQTSSEEKVNIVGHSLGGVVALDFLTFDQGNKTEKIVAAGSPLKGAVHAYPPWSGGEIMEDNFLIKVFLTLYSKHCDTQNTSDRVVIRNQIPSIQSVLPTFDYLKNKTGFKPVSSMDAKNNLLPLNIAEDFWGVDFMTLSGTGFKTPSGLNVKNPTAKEVSGGDWLDGKPYGNPSSTMQGDGTVLLSSSKIDNTYNVTINQNHGGLVSSGEGQAKILEFLNGHAGLLRVASNMSKAPKEPESMLVLIGSSNFWIKSPNGKIKKDENGILVINEPKSSFSVGLIPNSQNTTFIVAYISKSEKTYYKEVELNGFLPKTFKVHDLNYRNTSKTYNI